jgi:pimeloyl-ACP methyl ester carboxylesterase
VAFDVVAPSLPGFCLSGPTHDTGWGITRIASAWLELMTRLGHERFGVQGGDWGAVISRQIGLLAPERVTGIHINGNLGAPAPEPAELAMLTDAERERLAILDRFRRERLGYAGIQSTRPQTLAYALSDSPAGQFAWHAELYESFDPDEVGADRVDRDHLLTNAALYWFTGTAGSSARLYHEGAATAWGPQRPSTVPTGVAVFARDVGIRRFAERTNTIVHWSEFDRGGHFAALQAPDLLVGDLRAFFHGRVPAGPERNVAVGAACQR